MNSENLQQQTERFAEQLNAILSQVISTHAEYELTFLDQEKIFTDWKDGYKDILRESRLKWERLQARVATRRFRQEAIEELERLGYQISSPDQP